MRKFPEEETAAAKTEMREAFARRYTDDPRDPALKFAIMLTILGELMGEAIHSAGKDTKHRESLFTIAGYQIQNHMQLLEAQEKTK